MIKKNISRATLKPWLAVIIWLAVIFYFSNEPGLTIGNGGINSFILRKFAHISEFGILAALIVFSLLRTFEKKRVLVFVTAFLITVFFAFVDEFHQTFILGRDGNFKDVLVDTLGAALFLQIIAVIFFVKRRWLLISAIFVNLLAIFLLLAFMVQAIAQDSVLYPKKISFEEKQSREVRIDSVADDVIIEAKVKAEKKALSKDSSGKVEKKLRIVSKKTTIPSKVLLPVPFSSQAPFGIWDEVHEEACEEMSLIMVKYYFDKKELTPEIAEMEIQKLKDYQIKKNGHYIDSDMKEVSELAIEYFGLENSFVKKNITKQEIIKSLSEGSPVIVPTAGRLLGNPNFSGPGPLYHNLVIIGFEGDEFITNDPGTRNGKEYRYRFETIIKAIHDYTGNKYEIEKGGKSAVFFTK